MTDFDDFYRDIDATGPGIVHIGAHSQTAGSIRLKIFGYQLLIVIVGEPPSSTLLEHFQRGLAMKQLHPSMLTLVDMTRYIGVVDWSVLPKLRALAPWGEDPAHPSRTAYLVRESNAAMVVKAVSAIFPQSEHQTFTEKAQAIRWLAAAQA